MVSIPSTINGLPVTAIGGLAFSPSSSLTNVTIPDTVISIGYSAFGSCTNLASIAMGNGVTTIGPFAFRDCISLTSVTIPDNLTSIGESAGTYSAAINLAVRVPSREGMVKVNDRWWGPVVK